VKAALALILGGAGFLFGGVLAAALVAALSIAVYTSGDPRGGDTLFKIAWSSVAFAIGPLGAAAFPVALGGRRLAPEALGVAVLVALLLYGLTAWIVADWLSVVNDCGFGVAWPDPSVPGCD
jgi:hypothetical protein